jgi:hypothetical protein
MSDDFKVLCYEDTALPPHLFKWAELTKIKLEPGDVLSVKLFHDETVEDEAAKADMHSLKRMLDSVFPNNKVIVFALPPASDILFEVVKQPLTESEPK